MVAVVGAAYLVRPARHAAALRTSGANATSAFPQLTRAAAARRARRPCQDSGFRARLPRALWCGFWRTLLWRITYFAVILIEIRRGAAGQSRALPRRAQSRVLAS